MLLLLLLSVQCAGGKEFPNPQKEWRMCGMARPAFVCDPDFILPRGDAERLDQIASEFRKSTSCPCQECGSAGGVSLGIFIRHNVSVDFRNGRALAETLRQRWALSACGSDIVLVLLTHQNTSSFSLGPAVSSLLPESTVSRIVSECRVHFDSGWYYQGLESIANSLNDVLVRVQRREKPVFKNLLLGIGLGFGVLLVLAIVALLLLQRHNRKRTRSYCSDIYEGLPTRPNRRKSSFSLEEQSDEEEVFQPRSLRLNRQLSDVAEESPEDLKHFSPPKGNVPVTEL